MIPIESLGGVERWSVKTGADVDAIKVDLTSQPTTIADLINNFPATLPVNPDLRISPVEFTTFWVSGLLIAHKVEADGDYHVVINDSAHRSMIVELPDPAACIGSIWPKQIAAARKNFEKRFGLQIQMLTLEETLAPPGSPTPMMSSLSIPVTVTGVGFFDKIHGQMGVAPNGIELHPVLSIDFP